MKKHLLTITLISISIFGCKEEEPTPPVDNHTPSYAFIDQNAQGVIGGESWEFVSGTVQYDDWQDLFWFDLYNVSDSIPCDFDTPFTNKILFGREQLTIGLAELGFTNSATFYESDSSENFIAFDGAIEILTIDTIANIVTGRLDIREGNENNANGNFSLTYCR